jgi:hypothetical protein
MPHGSIISAALNTTENSHPGQAVAALIHDILSTPPAPPQQITQDVSAIVHNVVYNSPQPDTHVVQNISTLIHDVISNLPEAPQNTSTLVHTNLLSEPSGPGGPLVQDFKALLQDLTADPPNPHYVAQDINVLVQDFLDSDLTPNHSFHWHLV